LLTRTNATQLHLNHDGVSVDVMNTRTVRASFVSTALLAVIACSDTPADPAPIGVDGGSTSSSGASTSGGGIDGGVDPVFTPPVDPGKGGFLVTVSGESIAKTGFGWTSASLAEGDPPAFIDGWELRYEHILVTLGSVKLSADPDKDEGNPATVGPVVASAAGPWAIDLVKGGNVTGKSGEPDERTVAIAAFAKQDDGKSFDAATRYAFSYDTVAPGPTTKVVNLDEAAKVLLAEAKAKGYAMMFTGVATYKGPEAAAGSAFAGLTKVVNFKLGFKNPSTYANCRNTDLQAVGDEFPRGVQASASQATTVQVTMHTDHAFWNKLNVEGSPLHFDAIAAQASTFGMPDMPGTVTTEDLAAADVTGFKTKSGVVLPWRSLVSDFTAPAGQLKYDANGTSFSKANSFAEFIAYSAASGGHMNADGECEIKNNF
jgi:hypothetical protein